MTNNQSSDVGEEDWGDSKGAGLAQLKEANQQKRFQLRYQLTILIVFFVFTVVVLVLDAVTGKQNVKDLLPLVLPVVTFLLGKSERQNNE